MNTPTTIARRHDLDALRAIAMLLGIALHAALAYMPLPAGGWPVQDVHQSGGFSLFMSVVHGFRMPLFFLISGFFTAMLWRKRGLKALLAHRFKRIFLPLFIGMFTLVPAVWIVSIAAGIAGGPGRGAEDNIWNAASLGDLEQIHVHVAAGAPLDEPDLAAGVTPMAMAAARDHSEAVALLIEKGADVDAGNVDGTTPLQVAAFFGHPETARLLLEHDASVDARNKKGDGVIEMLKFDWATTQFVAGISQVKVDRERLMSGRKEVALLLGESQQTLPTETATSGWMAEETTNLDEVDNAVETKEDAVSGLLMFLTLFPFYHHLWFLAFLCWLVLAFALYAIAADLLKWKAPQWAVLSPLRYAWLIPLTIVPQSMMGLMFPTFGPDTSAGILPMPQVLLYYAIFFFFGAIYFDCSDDDGRVGRGWRVTLPLALFVVFPLGLEFTMGRLGFADALLDAQYHRPVSVVLQVLYVWLMSFGMMGLFRSLCSGESKASRYVSDSSYWLYLAHLPLIIVAQAIVRPWDLPALAKFGLVCVVTSALLLLSYQWFVRYTPIGTLLNGPRVRPARIPAEVDPLAAASQ